MRHLLPLILIAGFALPAQAEDAHLAAAGDIRIVHPWARAASVGGETLVFMEIENLGATDRLLGAQTALAEDVHIVGLTLSGDTVSVTEIGAVDVRPGDFHLDPGGLALELHGLTADLVAGTHFDLVVTFETAGAIALEVEVEAADATQHSHAGHSH
jgi:copper(I)-binding protein